MAGLQGFSFGGSKSRDRAKEKSVTEREKRKKAIKAGRTASKGKFGRLFGK